jgi:hypothetical protein
MITEFIKRQQKMGFNEDGSLAYKVPVDGTFAVDATFAPAQEEFVLYDDVEED